MKREEKSVEVAAKSKKRNKYVAEKKSVKKKERVNIFKKASKYFKGVLKEIKRIRWTNKKDLLKYSIASIMFVMFFALYFYAIEWIAVLVRS